MKIFMEVLLALLLIIAGLVFLVSQPLLSSPVKQNSPEVSAKQLEKNVRFLSEVLPSRLGNEALLTPTVLWIEQQLKPFATTTEDKSYRQSYKVENENFHNILMNFSPSSKAKSEEVIIIGAHYDTAHGFTGADDNASGVAALIELARLLSQNKEKLTHTVQLAFYPLEEPPYFRTNKMGSYVHAKSLSDKQQKVKLMISLDMIGYFSDEENSQDLPFPLMDKIYPTKGNFIALVTNLSNMFSIRKVKASFKSASELPVHSINAPAFVVGIDFSDHLNFWHFGYPALMVTDTSFNRNKHYHTKEDTADKLDYVKMAEVVKALFRTAIDLSSE